MLLLTSCFSITKKAIQEIESLTNIDLMEIKKDARNTYYAKHYYKNDIKEKGITYIFLVYDFNQKPEEFLNKYSFSNDKSDEFESDYNKNYVEFYSGFNVPREYDIDFNLDYYWLEKSNVFFVYETNINKLTVFLVK